MLSFLGRLLIFFFLVVQWQRCANNDLLLFPTPTLYAIASEGLMEAKTEAKRVSPASTQCGDTL